MSEEAIRHALKAITVWVSGDRLREQDELFYLDLSSAADVLFDESRGRGTIVNDD